MSQSPVSKVTEENTVRYRQGWRALNRLLHENRSFSGHERHCAFLNCGVGNDGTERAFADVSAAIGFNHADDGRGLACIDWDFDGDLDVWTTNRTAPRVRFLRNSNRSGHHFVAIQLRGTGPRTNRDAIGARVELYLQGDPQPRIKTLHAGQAFLSQASRWLHFGLGASQSIEKLVVHWPGGSREEIGGVRADKFHVVTQGQNTAVTWSPPGNRASLAISEPLVSPTEEVARIVVPPGMLLPSLWTLDAQKKPAEFKRKEKGVLLVNLWASYCGPCVEELTEWAMAAEAIREQGIEVIALNTDAVLGNPKATERAREVIEKTKFPFPWEPADGLTVRNLDAFVSGVLDLWLPLPVPSSFLVDEQGEVLVIYKGPVHAAQIVNDAALATATPEARRDAALTFPGRWLTGPTTGDSRRVANQLLDRDEGNSAVRYLESLMNVQAADATDEDGKRELADTGRLLGLILEQFGRLPEAQRHLATARNANPEDVRIRTSLAAVYRRLGEYRLATAETTAAIKINPSNLTLHDQLAELYAAQEQFSQAIQRCEMILKIDPKRARTRYQMANAMLASGQAKAAIAEFKKTLSANPRFLEAANQLSRVLSSHPDPALRSPREAYVLSSRLCQMTKNKDPRFLDTRASAAAAMGNFPGAVQAAEQALAQYRRDPRYANRIPPLETRLELFRNKKAWIEPAWR